MTEQPRPPRVLIAKPGLDGHDRGAKIVARALRDAGCEVIYLGVRHSPREIAAAALQEDVDVIGLSVLSGTHVALVRKLRAELDAHEIDASVIIGGTIPEHDEPALRELGVVAVFPTSSKLTDITAHVCRLANDRAAASPP